MVHITSFCSPAFFNFFVLFASLHFFIKMFARIMLSPYLCTGFEKEESSPIAHRVCSHSSPISVK